MITSLNNIFLRHKLSSTFTLRSLVLYDEVEVIVILRNELDESLETDRYAGWWHMDARWC